MIISGEGFTGTFNVVSLGSLRLDVGGDLSNTFVTGHTGTAGGSWLERQDSFEHVTRGLGISGNLSILMHTESFGLGVKRQLLNVSHVVSMTSSGDTSVILGVREVEIVCKDIRYEVTTDNAENESSVNVISHTATVVNLSDQEVEHLVWHFIEIVEENLQLLLAHTVIFIGEGVRNIPADTTELSSILDDSMEEAEGKEHFLVGGRLLAAVKIGVINILISLDQVRADTRWGFKCHLHRVLQGGDRELGGGHGGHPETEIRVDVLVKGLNNLLEFRHPGEAEMAVLEENPHALVLTLLDQILSGLLLSSTERDSSHTGVHSNLTAVLVPGSIGISSSGEHEN